MWRPVLTLVLLAGIFILAQTPSVDAQSQFPPFTPPGVCETTPCQGFGALTCSTGQGFICQATNFGCSVACSCSPAAQLGSLLPTGIGPSAAQGVRYATYNGGSPPLPPITGPNPQVTVADAIVPYSTCFGVFAPIYAFPGSWGYNYGPRRGFNPFATSDAYRQTLDAVVAPDGAGYILSWTSGTTFSGSSHEVFQCPEADTPVMACRSVGVVNAETRTFGPVPGGFTYVVRSQGYSGYTGTISWGTSQEAGSSRLPLPLIPPANLASQSATE
ncbi:MAG TPA: hypothetical protein VII06_22530 [Chloroflexota bacterium]|jgi:hypothetical protein